MGGDKKEMFLTEIIWNSIKKNGALFLNKDLYYLCSVSMIDKVTSLKKRKKYHQGIHAL